MIFVFILFFIALTNAQNCGRTSKWIGASGSLSSFAYQVGGQVLVVDDCTVEISNFRYTGGGPDAFIYVADKIVNLDDGLILDELPRGTQWSGTKLTVKIPNGIDSIAPGDTFAISVWCREFSVDFGSVEITPLVQTDSCAEWVGATGTLSRRAHRVAGTLTVKADCTFLLTDFSYDGFGPNTWWVVGGGAENLLNRNSFQLQDAKVTRGFDNECSAETTKDGFAWSDAVGTANQISIGLYCVSAGQLFGAVTLTKPSVASQDNLPAVCETGTVCPERNGDCLSNCVRLDTYYYLWWEVVDSDVVIELEAAVDDQNTWLGFGVADKFRYGMIGSDVAIAGFHNGRATVEDYFLESKAQCNYNSGADRGVCPDDNMRSCPGLPAGSTGRDNIVFLSAELREGIQRMRFRRPLVATDACDRSFEADSRVVWATGPITQGSPQLVVNVHGIPNTPGVGGHSPFPGTNDASTRFDARSTPGVQAGCIAVPQKTGSVGAAVCRRKMLIRGVTTFDFTVSDFESHPSPPSWGVGWHIQGNEFAELIVERGTTYTFNIDSGDLHPFYITDNEVGGRANLNEPIFAGSANAHKAVDGAPFVLEWTPNANTPDLVYYACWTHQKLGWRIYVVDAGQSNSFVPPVDTASRCPGDPLPTAESPTTRITEVQPISKESDSKESEEFDSESEVESDSASTIAITKIIIVLTTIIMLF